MGRLEECLEKRVEKRQENSLEKRLENGPANMYRESLKKSQVKKLQPRKTCTTLFEGAFFSDLFILKLDLHMVYMSVKSNLMKCVNDPSCILIILRVFL